MTNQPTPTRVRICSHITQSRFLHVEDALGIGQGKIRLFGGTFRRGEGMGTCAAHFLDLADARVVFQALARGETGFSHQEYKGTPPQNGNGAVSRVLSITVKGEDVYVELKSGPGKLTNTGAISPNGRPDVAVNVGFKRHEARRLGASVLAYINAWDVMRMMANQHLASKPAPYLLAPATSEAGEGRTPAAPAANGMSQVPMAAANKGRPVTRKDPMPKGNGPATGQRNGRPLKPAPVVNGQPASRDAAAADARLLKYGNGSEIDRANVTEVETFQQFVAEKKTVPESKAVLLDYYRQRLPVGVSSQ